MTDDFMSTFSPRPRSFAERVGGSDAPADALLPLKEEVVGNGPYKPYGFLPTGTINETCDVQRWLDGTEMPEGIEFQYRFLMQIGYIGEEQIKLFLPDCIILIEGKNLRDLRKKLARRQITFIQQFNTRVWPKHPDAGEPVVDATSVLVLKFAISAEQWLSESFQRLADDFCPFLIQRTSDSGH